jgi:hypothetical protein
MSKESKAKPKAGAEREVRAAAALRENLRRRKQQTQTRIVNNDKPKDKNECP